MLRHARYLGMLALVAGACRGVGDQTESVARTGAAAPSGVPKSALADEAAPSTEGDFPQRIHAAARAASVRSRPFAIVEACTPPARAKARDVGAASDVVYVTRDGKPLRLDVTWPLDGATHPLVLLVHGGAWVGGDRLYHRDDAEKLAGAGFVAATIDYRLAGPPGAAFPAPLQDLRCAVRFLRERSADYRIDPRRVGAIGDSAGGHLVAMLATADDLADDASCPAGGTSRIQSAVVDYAPLDLRASRSYPPSIQLAMRILLGADPAADADRAAWASPITHLDAGDPPLLIVHAAHDRTVPVESSRAFAEAATRAGVRSLYLELASPSLGHGFLVLGSGEVLRRSTCTTMAFLASTLR